MRLVDDVLLRHSLTLATGFKPDVGRVVAQQNGRHHGDRQGDHPQHQPGDPPPLHAVEAVHGGDEQAGEDDGGAVADDHQPGRPASAPAAEPVRDEDHCRDIGEAAADADAEVEKKQGGEAMTAGDGEHA